MAVQVDVRDDGVDVRFSGWDAVWAFKRRLFLPMGEVRGAAVVPRREALGMLRWRVGGTGLPGVVAAGRFTLKGRPGDRAFVSVYRDEEVLRIETDRPRHRFVLLQHPQRHDLAWYIGERVG